MLPSFLFCNYYNNLGDKYLQTGPISWQVCTLNCMFGGSSLSFEGESNSLRAYVTSYRVIVVWSATIEFFYSIVLIAFCFYVDEVIFVDDFSHSYASCLLTSEYFLEDMQRLKLTKLVWYECYAILIWEWKTWLE